MNQKQNEELDSMIDEFLNVFKDHYSSPFNYTRITESKSRSIDFVFGGKRGRFTKNGKK